MEAGKRKLCAEVAAKELVEVVGQAGTQTPKQDDSKMDEDGQAADDSDYGRSCRCVPVVALNKLNSRLLHNSRFNCFGYVVCALAFG